MTLTGRMVLVGLEEKLNQKGEPFVMVALVQNADTVSFMCKDLAVLKMPLYKEYTISLIYNTKYERLSIQTMHGI